MEWCVVLREQLRDELAPATPRRSSRSPARAEAYVDGRWDRVGPGDVCHVRGDTRHGFRNLEQEPSVMIL